VRPGEPLPETPGLRHLVAALLRRDSLCGSPSACVDAREVRCGECQIVFTPADIRMPSETPCPGCGSQRYVRMPCEVCPAADLDDSLAGSGQQPLLDRAIQLDLALRKGFNMTLDDITMEEFGALSILWSERDNHDREQAQEREQKMKEQMHHASPV